MDLLTWEVGPTAPDAGDVLGIEGTQKVNHPDSIHGNHIVSFLDSLAVMDRSSFTKFRKVIFSPTLQRSDDLRVNDYRKQSCIPILCRKKIKGFSTGSLSGEKISRIAFLKTILWVTLYITKEKGK